MIVDKTRNLITGRNGLALAIAIGASISFILNQSAEVGQLISPSEMVDQARALDGSPSILGRSSTVTVVLFTDYRCPACRRSDNTLLEAVEADGRVDLIVRPLTLFGEDSNRAARAALAGAKQGRFLAMHRALMATPKVDDDGLAEAARSAGIDPSQLRTEMASHALATDRLLAKNRLAAFGLGFEGTPSYLIGRYRVTGALSARQIRRLFEKARSIGSVT